jgi:hypothetical protein
MAQRRALTSGRRTVAGFNSGIQGRRMSPFRGMDFTIQLDVEKRKVVPTVRGKMSIS